MPIAHEILAALPLTALTSATALGASITGTITGPDGRPFMGAFVAAENPQSRMTVNVLSDAQGRYRISNLPGATYTVRIEVVGYTSEPRGSVALAVDATASLDFALKKTRPVERRRGQGGQAVDSLLRTGQRSGAPRSKNR